MSPAPVSGQEHSGHDEYGQRSRLGDHRRGRQFTKNPVPRSGGMNVIKKEVGIGIGHDGVATLVECGIGDIDKSE